MNYTLLCTLVKALWWKLLNSFAIPRSVLFGCHGCWQLHIKRQRKQSPLIFGTNWTLEMRASYCIFGWVWNLGRQVRTQVQAAFYACLWGCSELWLLCWSNNKSECSPLSSLSHKKIVWSVYCSMTVLDYTQIHALQRPSEILDEQCCYIHPTVLASYH